MSVLQRTALFFTIIGALNWGVIGLFQFDVVASLFGGQGSVVSRIIYTVVGIAGLVNLGILFKPSEEIVRTEHRVARTT
ncbi:DUF378 domain-containing protein [Viridibacillus sp. YIM B01967]|uniref:DUF378 domain-containing protein n=1 Tax=Viridibacillus soli TaxID=2798301 RepID=A0ABS1H9V9_9BACL|nr:DUF378 domain-containing protein [Viridibacillus soli]MBK3496205.1 DUF378 domain-containing protein [Viridibacillus soli]